MTVMSSTHTRPRPRRLTSALLATALLTGTAVVGSSPAFAVDQVPVASSAPDPADPAAPEVAPNPAFPVPSTHTQQAYDPEANFTSIWTRADALQLRASSDPNAPAGANSIPLETTMPEIPTDFPILLDQNGQQIWVWDTWTLTDAASDQISFKGWEVIFSLTADPNAGYAFDDRHTHARMGFFYRKADVPTADRPENGGWIYGGHVFPEGAAGAIYEDQSFSAVTEWSGSTRIMDGNKLRIFYTAVAFYRDANNVETQPADARIAQTEARIFADEDGVWMTGARDHHQVLVPDGTYYQTREQNPNVNFRDPFTFEDPAHPGKTFMVFEGNTAGDRGAVACTEADLGYQPGDPLAEDPATVTASGANFQMANVGLAVADNAALTEWTLLPPILSANCVNDQTERPQMYVQDGKYYLFTITHRHTFSRGSEADSVEPRFWYMDGPDGVYGFVGDGIRSDFQPLNGTSGLVLGNPTNLNFPVGTPAAPAPGQTANTFQSYSHYVMPGGLVESFIDSIGNPDVRRGGTLSPTVKLNITGSSSAVDRSYGNGGLGGYGDIPANRAQDVPQTPNPRPIP